MTKSKLDRSFNDCDWYGRHYRKSVGALLFFDLTEVESFRNAQKWLKEIENHTEEGIKIMLIGNKLDLVEENPSLRCVNRAEVLDFARKHNLLYEETSALSGSNVKESFQNIIEGKITKNGRELTSVQSDIQG